MRADVVNHDVFISYSEPDKAKADAVCSLLERKSIRCWVAPRDILPGMTWGSSIVRAIQQSKVFILVFSSHSNHSPQVVREVERAV
ncbi:MAG: toll/interleukin-1 receptor domain-containing protein, partial [Gemmatimonadota bacterium]